jgi:hypothetical protein
MSKIHIVVLNCHNKHAYGGSAYRDDNPERRQEAIDSIKGIARAVYATGQMHCPLCHSLDFEITDIRTNYETWDEARPFIEDLKKQQDEAIRSGNPNVALFDLDMRAFHVEVTKIDPTLN